MRCKKFMCFVMKSILPVQRNCNFLQPLTQMTVHLFNVASMVNKYSMI